MNPRIHPLGYYVDRLRVNDYFSLARYGDGELYCLWGREGSNCDGSDYTPELRDDLKRSLLKYPDPNFIYGLQHVLPEDREKILIQTPAIRWVDSEVFGDALVEGKLYPLIEQLNRMNVILVGNESLRGLSNVLHYNMLIKIPEKNAHLARHDVYRYIFNYGEPGVYLFSAGMAANVFVSDLHGMIPDSFFLDVGHIWDVFVGNPPRSNTEHMTKADIEKNLKP